MAPFRHRQKDKGAGPPADPLPPRHALRPARRQGDRKSGVEGKRGDLGGRRIIKKKKGGMGDLTVTGVQTCALPISGRKTKARGLPQIHSHLGMLSAQLGDKEIGRAAWRERGEISVGAGSLKKKRGAWEI